MRACSQLLHYQLLAKYGLLNMPYVDMNMQEHNNYLCLMYYAAMTKESTGESIEENLKSFCTIA